MKEKKVYIVCKIMQSGSVNGHAVNLASADTGMIGMMPVFKTKTAARKMFGKNVELLSGTTKGK